MRIVVLGAGTVGSSVAELLCQHGHAVTVVDNDSSNINRLKEVLDIRGITGSASRSSVMFQAGVMQSDLTLAVTGNDEVNLIAASIAKSMGSRRTVARVFAPVFRDLSTFDYQRHFNIDRMMSLEHLSAMELARAIRQSGSVVVENFARGELEMREFVVVDKATAIGEPLKNLNLPSCVRVGSILRDGKMWLAGADDRFEVGDWITLIGTRDDIDTTSPLFQRKATSKLSVVIAGGGETGFHLARQLEILRYSVLLMEADEDRAEFLSTNLNTTTVIHNDATQQKVLEEERVGTADVFVACTGDDENNIMASVEAREIGAKRIMAIVGRPDYARVIGKLGIDVAVSPRNVMAKEVLGYIQKGAVVSRRKLTGGTIEVVEVEVLPNVPATEHVLANLDLPDQCLIAALIREAFVQVPGADDFLKPGDTVVALVESTAADEMLRLFSVDGQLE